MIDNYMATGIFFIFLIALNNKLKKVIFLYKNTTSNLKKYLDLVALGTVCDLFHDKS